MTLVTYIEEDFITACFEQLRKGKTGLPAACTSTGRQVAFNQERPFQFESRTWIFEALIEPSDRLVPLTFTRTPTPTAPCSCLMRVEVVT